MTEKSCIQRTSIASKRTNGARESEWKKITNQNTTSHFRYFPSLLYFDRARNTNGALHFSCSSQFTHLFVFKLVFALRAPIRTLSISTNKSINMQEVCMCLLCCRLSFSLATVFFVFVVWKLLFCSPEIYLLANRMSENVVFSLPLIDGITLFKRHIPMFVVAFNSISSMWFRCQWKNFSIALRQIRIIFET